VSAINQSNKPLWRCRSTNLHVESAPPGITQFESVLHFARFKGTYHPNISFIQPPRGPPKPAPSPYNLSHPQSISSFWSVLRLTYWPFLDKVPVACYTIGEKYQSKDED
jgi:hypothetical protein